MTPPQAVVRGPCPRRRSVDDPPLAVGVAASGAVDLRRTPLYVACRLIFAALPAGGVGPGAAWRVGDRWSLGRCGGTGRITGSSWRCRRRIAGWRLVVGRRDRRWRREIRWWWRNWRSKKREAERNPDANANPRGRRRRRRDHGQKTECPDDRGCADAGDRERSPRVDHWGTPGN